MWQNLNICGIPTVGRRSTTEVELQSELAPPDIQSLATTTFHFRGQAVVVGDVERGLWKILKSSQSGLPLVLRGLGVGRFAVADPVLSVAVAQQLLGAADALPCRWRWGHLIGRGGTSLLVASPSRLGL